MGTEGRLRYIHVLRRPRTGLVLGEMRERSNRTVSKTVELLAAPWVRIPLSPRALSQRLGAGASACTSMYAAALAPSMAQGEMTEWPKVHAWKACVLVRVPWVRIPLSPYNPFGVEVQVIRYELLPNPVRPGREQR